MGTGGGSTAPMVVGVGESTSGFSCFFFQGKKGAGDQWTSGSREERGEVIPRRARFFMSSPRAGPPCIFPDFRGGERDSASCALGRTCPWRPHLPRTVAARARSLHPHPDPPQPGLSFLPAGLSRADQVGSEAAQLWQVGGSQVGRGVQGITRKSLQVCLWEARLPPASSARSR